MKIPKKPTASPEAVDAFISGAKVEGQGATQAALPPHQSAVPAEAPAPVKARKKPVRMKEKVVRQTFVVNENIVIWLEAYAYHQRMTKKAVLEAALSQYFSDKKIKAIPRQ